MINLLFKGIKVVSHHFCLKIFYIFLILHWFRHQFLILSKRIRILILIRIWIWICWRSLTLFFGCLLFIKARRTEYPQLLGLFALDYLFIFSSSLAFCILKSCSRKLLILILILGLNLLLVQMANTWPITHTLFILILNCH